MCGSQTDKGELCQACYQSLPSLPKHCPQCAQFIQTNEYRCGQCLNDPPPFDRTLALFPYEAPIISFIIQLKFHGKLPIARFFCDDFIRRIKSNWYAHSPLPDLILPMPLHRARLRERGFNQALLVAKPIAKALYLPLDITGMKRIKATAAQSGLTARKRRHNIKNAFSCERDYHGLTIALLDDVVTTGSTVSECSRTLKSRGAKEVHIWCCAKRG